MDYFRFLIKIYGKAQQIGAGTPYGFSYTLHLYRGCEKYIIFHNQKRNAKTELIEFVMNDLERIITEA